ncbi:hypothetical protein ACFST9_24660 [Hymenobacter monticola]|uniref:Uncharacterized protein n=1 Tax=Hymenobacter monticola TaxID=1705399 RepID=A0ABY4B6P5_9BACT|nr:hypothetical protein [Hymenobacter monticola]UOE34834.1 hypothetical protein MTP16_04070 [Hymenobacter monticola]
MQTGIRYLAEDDTYKVYSLYESVYLKTKATSQKLSEAEKGDLPIAWHYGDPAAAILLYSGNHVVVVGCGITIYDIKQQLETTMLDAPDNIWWTDGLYQDGADEPTECRFVSLHENGGLRVFKLNALTQEVQLLP